MSRIFWDTNLFIYLFEDYGEFSQQVARLRGRILERGDRLFTSTLTLGEVLVRPLETGNEVLRQRYTQTIPRVAVLIPLDDEAALLYASIRRDRTIRPADAIQLASAAQAGIDLFITNDERLSEKTIPGIQFVSSLQRAFL